MGSILILNRQTIRCLSWAMAEYTATEKRKVIRNFRNTVRRNARDAPVELTMINLISPYIRHTMARILITGATGNVGSETIEALQRETHEHEVVAAVRDPEKQAGRFAALGITAVHFDQEDPTTFALALAGVEVLFLLRPPQISDVQRYFGPLIATALEQKVEHIVFLSVQGVENSSIIPHHKIEKLIRESGIPYTFLRPAYFMQNFTTTLRKDLVEHDRIFLPAGDARFTLIDVADLGRVAAKVLVSPEEHRGQAYDLTNSEQYTFSEMADIIGTVTGRKIAFISPSLLRFFIQKRKEKVPAMFILVMIMLHYLPRFQKVPPITDRVERITATCPATLIEFMQRNRSILRR